MQSNKSGVLESVFDYGDVNMTFANILDQKKFMGIPKPLFFVEALNKIKSSLIDKKTNLYTTSLKKNDLLKMEEDDGIVI